jgi:hypothetical protein
LSHGQPRGLIHKGTKKFRRNIFQYRYTNDTSALSLPEVAITETVGARRIGWQAPLFSPAKAPSVRPQPLPVAALVRSAPALHASSTSLPPTGNRYPVALTLSFSPQTSATAVNNCSNTKPSPKLQRPPRRDGALSSPPRLSSADIKAVAKLSDVSQVRVFRPKSDHTANR